MPQLGQPSSLFYRVTSGLDESERNDLLQELVYLGNQAMSADRVPMDDLAQTEQTLQRTAGYLLPGLAQLCGQRQPKPAALTNPQWRLTCCAACRWPICSGGHSLTQHVRKLAKLLVDGGATTVDKTLSPTSLLPKPEADALLRDLAPRASASPSARMIPKERCPTVCQPARSGGRRPSLSKSSRCDRSF